MTNLIVGSNHLAVAVNQAAIKAITDLYLKSLQPIEGSTKILFFLKLSYKIQFKKLAVSFVGSTATQQHTAANADAIAFEGGTDIQFSFLKMKKDGTVRLSATVLPAVKNRELVATLLNFEVLELLGASWFVKWLINRILKVARQLLIKHLTEVPIYPVLFSVDGNGNPVSDPSKAAVIVELKEVMPEKANQQISLRANVTLKISKKFEFPLETGQARIVLN